jgi:hypothetical protein
MLSSRLN